MNYSTDENFNNEVVRLLRAYKVNKVKIQLNSIEIEGIDEVLAKGKFHSREDEYECIEGMSLQAQKLDDMPRHHSNLFRSSTERAALDYVTEIYWHTDREELLKKQTDIRSRTYRFEMEVRQVDALLGVLSRDQRFVIEQFYIEGYNWPEISEQYSLTYKMNYTTNTLQSWRDKALVLMENVYLKCG